MPSRLVLSSTLLAALLSPSTHATNLYQCTVSDFYSGFDPASFSSPTSLKSALKTYIDNHDIISYTSTTDPLRDLDELDATHVRGIYKLTGILKSDFPNGWNREHCWPRSRGVGDSGADTSDLFNLFAADMNLNSARGNKWFDTCTVGSNGCVSPAGTSTEDAAAGSMESSDVWAPPPSVRGDMARAAFYMAVRYDGSDSGTVDLEIAECSTDATCAANRFGRLSTLVQWHHDDPVSDEERLRVQKICTKYQGNRNPFVDFPELVDVIFGGGAAASPTSPPATGPTPFPTAFPTVPPVTPSTPFPTSFPTAGGCVDSVPSGLVWDDGSDAPCSEVGSYCDLDFVVEACPRTCDACSTTRSAVVENASRVIPASNPNGRSSFFDVYGLYAIVAGLVLISIASATLAYKKRYKNQMRNEHEPTKQVTGPKAATENPLFTDL